MTPQNFTMIVETVEKYKVSEAETVFFLSQLINKTKSTFFYTVSSQFHFV